MQLRWISGQTGGAPRPKVNIIYNIPICPKPTRCIRLCCEEAKETRPIGILGKIVGLAELFLEKLYEGMAKIFSVDKDAGCPSYRSRKLKGEARSLPQLSTPGTQPRALKPYTLIIHAVSTSDNGESGAKG